MSGNPETIRADVVDVLRKPYLEVRAGMFTPYGARLGVTIRNPLGVTRVQRFSLPVHLSLWSTHI
jgi:hypothetical protein